MPQPTESVDLAELLTDAILIDAKAIEDIFADTEIWEAMRQTMMAVVIPLFREAFMVGAELAAEERPSLSRDYTADQVVLSLAGFRALPFDADRAGRVADNVIASYADDWWRQFSRTTQNRLRRAIQRSVDEGTGVRGVLTDIEPIFGTDRAKLIAISETTNLMGMGAHETYREAGYTEWEWRTSNDSHVDPICRQREGRIFPMSVRFERAHPGCRCWPVPAGMPAGFGDLNSKTTDLFTTASGRWTPERQLLHDQIVTDFLRGVQPVAADEQPTMYVMGGGPASGKSSVLESGAVRIPQNVVKVDPDAIKQRLPEYQRMVQSGDARAAAFTHDESSYLSQRIVSEATAEHYNVLLDGTGDGGYEKLVERIEMYREHGHRIVGEYVSLDTERALEIQRIRAAATGREVPESYLREVHASISEIMPRVLREGHFDEFRLWDTNVKDAPRLVATYEDGDFTIHNQALWERFLAKADRGFAVSE